MIPHVRRWNDGRCLWPRTDPSDLVTVPEGSHDKAFQLTSDSLNNLNSMKKLLHSLGPEDNSCKASGGLSTLSDASGV